jgi:hypothetical protein
MADAFPQRFVWERGAEHAVVVLNADGTAAYSARESRSKHKPGAKDYYFVATRASWKWCDLGAPSARRCIFLSVDGFDGREAGFRFDYWYDEKQLVEFDKMGEQRVLRRRDEY